MSAYIWVCQWKYESMSAYIWGSQYLATLLMASVSGGGIMRQAPGRVSLCPPLLWTTQFKSSELDFRVSFSPRTTEFWITVDPSHNKS